MSDPPPFRRNESPTDYLPRERRTIYVVDRDFQFRYLTNWLILTLVYIGVIVGVLYMGLRVLHHADPQHAFHQLSYMIEMNGLFVILLTVFLGLYTILLSHRIAGPAYRISKCLQRVTAGDYEFSVVLRKRDYLKDVAGDFNAALTDLRRRRTQVKVALEAAKRMKSKVTGEEASREMDQVCAGLEEALKTVEAKDTERKA